jgi:hypothetical protein
MLILLLIVLVILLGFAVSGPMGAPWVPTFKHDVQAVLDDANVTNKTRYIELGCGDGRLIAAAARRGADATGYEINPLLWLIAWCRNLPHKNTHVRLGNFWPHTLTDYDVVVTFLMPKFMQRLEDKTTKELAKGAVLVSYVFPLPHKKPAIKRHHWFVYTYNK